MIRNATKEDVQAITDIYNYYVEHSVATFEEELVSSNDMALRIEQVTSDEFPWIVLEYEGQVAGYAYASQWKGRSAYRFSVESTVYVSPQHLGLGVGKKLYSSLFELLENTRAKSIIACLTLPNDASVALHEKLGLKKVGHFESVGFKFGQWLDVGYWQKKIK